MILTSVLDRHGPCYFCGGTEWDAAKKHRVPDTTVLTCLECTFTYEEHWTILDILESGRMTKRVYPYEAV